MRASAKQIKLGRILLDWKQQDLAGHAGVSVATVNSIETGSSDPREKTLLALVSALEVGGIEFIEGDGVRRRENVIQTYKGLSGFRTFMNDVYETARDYGGDICLFNSRPTLWIEHLGRDWYGMHRRRMEALGDSIRVRIAVEEGESDFILDTAEHRCFTAESWKGKVFYAYGPKLAFLDFADQNLNIRVLEEPAYTESFRILFDCFWKHETSPPQEVS